LAVAATYESIDDGETGVQVIVSHDLTQWGDTIRVQNGMAIVAVRKTEVEARPRRGDTFTMEDSRVYQVEQVMRSDDLEHRCLVTENGD
jgi:hypothetical protein